MGESLPLDLTHHGIYIHYSDIRAVEKPRTRRDDVVQGDVLQALGIRGWRRQAADGVAFWEETMVPYPPIAWVDRDKLFQLGPSQFSLCGICYGKNST